MSAAKSLGSHQLNSFVAFLEEKFHTSSETSVVKAWGQHSVWNPWGYLCWILHSRWGQVWQGGQESAQSTHTTYWTEMGTRMEGVQVCYSQVHEEIRAQPSMLKTSIGTRPSGRSHQPKARWGLSWWMGKATGQTGQASKGSSEEIQRRLCCCCCCLCWGLC